MGDKNHTKKRKLKQLLQDLLENTSDSENSDDSLQQPLSDEEDSEMSCPLSALATTNNKPSSNELLTLLNKKYLNENTGPEVLPDIAELLSTFLLKGLDNEARKLTVETYPCLKNCMALKPPELNAEIKPCLTSATLRQDAFLTKLQGQLAAAVSALAVPLNTLYASIKDNPTEDNKKELEQLGDPLKLVADAFYSISNHRRYLLIPSLDNSVKDVLENCQIDSFLFGQNFAERLKSSKEAKKFGASIKKKPKLQIGAAQASRSTAEPLRPIPATSSKRSSHFLASRCQPPRARYKKEEEGRQPRRRQYQQ